MEKWKYKNVLQRKKQLLPEKMEILEGKFILDAQTTIICDKELVVLADFLNNLQKTATGFNLEVNKKGTQSIVFKLNSKLKKLGEEGYTLKVTSKNI